MWAAGVVVCEPTGLDHNDKPCLNQLTGTDENLAFVPIKIVVKDKIFKPV